ncbi:MAG: NAD-binding protein [Candidatus Korarchaeota archaeon]|nr:NAD-binding protein [Candidatus Korarchaeota archaeon]
MEELGVIGVRVVSGDATTGQALQRAGVPRARVLVVTVDDDLTNATVAERARKLNSRLRIVGRTFRSEVGELLRAGGAADATSAQARSPPGCSPRRPRWTLRGPPPSPRRSAWPARSLGSPPGVEPLSEGEVVLVQDLGLQGTRHLRGLGRGEKA